VNSENKCHCSCGNPMFGFPCVCEFVKRNPGNLTFSCEYCGLFTASKPRCNCCEDVTEGCKEDAVTIEIKETTNNG